jgi:predicted amidohydrolase YtcJ
VGEKLTPLWAHLTRRQVPVYLVNSRNHTQVVNRVLMAPVGIHVDVGIVRNPAPMAGLHAGATPIPATFGRLRRTAQSLNISRAMRESSR